MDILHYITILATGWCRNGAGVTVSLAGLLWGTVVGGVGPVGTGGGSDGVVVAVFRAKRVAARAHIPVAVEEGDRFRCTGSRVSRLVAPSRSTIPKFDGKTTLSKLGERRGRPRTRVQGTSGQNRDSLSPPPRRENESAGRAGGPSWWSASQKASHALISELTCRMEGTHRVSTTLRFHRSSRVSVRQYQCCTVCATQDR